MIDGHEELIGYQLKNKIVQIVGPHCHSPGCLPANFLTLSGLDDAVTARLILHQ